MASLTRTVYGSDGRGIQTITGSDGSVTQRVLEAQSRRVEAQVASNAQEPLVTWAGDGRIKPVGANNSYRPRGVQANTGLGKGDPVQLNGGLVSATPSNGGNSTELQSQIKAQAETLAKIAKNLPGQIGEGDPNTEATPGTKDVLPRYPDDTYYDESSGTLFVWDSDQESDPADPRWVPRHQLFQGFTGDPNDQSGSAVPVYLDGAIAVSGNKIYIGSVANGWSEFSSGGGGVQVSYLLSFTFANPPGGVVAMQFAAASFDNAGVFDASNNTRISLGSGVYEIQLRLEANFPGLSDPDYVGRWVFTCNFFDDTDALVTTEGYSLHEGRVNRHFLYPTFWINTVGTQISYATIFVSYGVYNGNQLISQPSSADYNFGRAIVKKLS